MEGGKRLPVSLEGGGKAGRRSTCAQALHLPAYPLLPDHLELSFPPPGIASEYSVKCSYLELYNEEITDLLAVGNEVPKVSRAQAGRIGTGATSMAAVPTGQGAARFGPLESQAP